MKELRNWLNENNSNIESADVKEFEGYGRGLCATRDITQNELFLSIPYHVQINRFNLKEIWPEIELPNFNEGNNDRDNLNGIVYLYLAVNKENKNCFHFPSIFYQKVMIVH